MDTWKYFDITHRDHTFMNPTTSGKLDEMVSLLDLRPGARVLDIACGKAEPLFRIADRYDVHGVGVDISPYCIRDAREAAKTRTSRSSTLEFVEMDGAKYPVQPDSIDLAVCLGATWVFGGYGGTLETLKRYVRPGGLVLVGEPYWIQEPHEEYLKMAGLTRDLFRTHSGNVLAGEEHGLIPIFTIVSSKEDFDRYDWLQIRAGERYILANPDDPDVNELKRRMADLRQEQTRFGRDTLGWAMYLLVKPPVPQPIEGAAEDRP